MADSPEANRIAADVASRIREADDAMHEADYAFAVGDFDAYWQREADAATQRVQDEYSRITATGSGGTGGGDQPDTGVPEDGGSGSPQ